MIGPLPRAWLGQVVLLGALFAPGQGCGPALGGTPGPEALLCRDDDADCQAINQSLEVIRRHIGAADPADAARQELFEIEPRLLRHLAQALDDRDPPVAEAAALALASIGGLPLVSESCRRTPRAHCGPAEALARDQARLDHRGRWRGALSSGPGGCLVEARGELELELADQDGLDGHVWLGPRRLPLLEVKRHGGRLDVWFLVGRDQHRLILRLSQGPRLSGTWLARGERHPLAVELAPVAP
jgi:hypothetical protein